MLVRVNAHPPTMTISALTATSANLRRPTCAPRCPGWPNYTGPDCPVNLRCISTAVIGSLPGDCLVPLGPVRCPAEMAQDPLEVACAVDRIDGRVEGDVLDQADLAVGHGEHQRQHGREHVGGQLVADT